MLGMQSALVLPLKNLHTNFVPHGQQISVFKAFKSDSCCLNVKTYVSLEQVADIRFRSEVNLADSSQGFEAQQRWRSLESTLNSQQAVGDVGAIRPLIPFLPSECNINQV